MQSRKHYEDEKARYFPLSVPVHNFYRRPQQRLDLSFLYNLTAPYYFRWERCLIGRWQATAELMLGTLINFLGLRKINTQGIKQAHKVMRPAATAYNLKKLLRFKPEKNQTAVMALPRPAVTTYFERFLPEKIRKNWNSTSKNLPKLSFTQELCNSYQCYMRFFLFPIS